MNDKFLWGIVLGNLFNLYSSILIELFTDFFIVLQKITVQLKKKRNQPQNKINEINSKDGFLYANSKLIETMQVHYIVGM